MYFDLTDEQRAIKATARDFLAARYKSERIRELAGSEHGFEPSDWEEMAGLGWPGLALPEEWGGQGLGIVELAVLFEEMGYALAPSPLFSNTIAGLALALCGSDEQRERWLRPLASGEVRGAPALWDAGTTATPGGFAMEARADGDGVVLDGEKVLVMDAASADFLLVATSDGRRHLVERGADGVTVAPERSIDLTRRLHSVRFDGVRVAASDTLPAARGTTTTRSSSASAWRLPPSRPGSPSAPLRWPLLRERPQAVRSSDRLLPGGLPPLRADAARDRELPLGRLRRRLGGPTPSPSRCCLPPRWRRPTPPTPVGACPTPRSKCTAGSASPGSTISTSSSSAARRMRRCSATPGGTASGSPTQSSARTY
jgi:hypothetical protein